MNDAFIMTQAPPLPRGCFSVPAVNSTTAEAHVVCPPANATVARGELCLFWVGSGATPEHAATDFYKLAASLGFHVISLAYPNTPSVSEACQGKPPSCFLSVRNERLYDPTTGGMLRFVTLLKLLIAKQQSSQGWAQYMAGAGSTLEDVAWEKVVAAGHSQGSGMALLISKRFSLAGVVQLAGVDDVIPSSPYPSPVPSSPYPSARFAAPLSSLADVQPAPWLSAPGATPASRLYGLGNGRGFCCNYWAATWPVLNMSGWMDVDRGPLPTSGGGHKLCSHADDGLSGHASVVSDILYAPSWAYMLTRAAGQAIPHNGASGLLQNCTCTSRGGESAVPSGAATASPLAAGLRPPNVGVLKAHIREYAALGRTHLTGSRDGDRTAAWVQAKLEQIGGLRVERQEVTTIR